MKKQNKISTYKHDVTVCINKIVAMAKKADPEITDITFELSSIKRLGSRPEKYKTGQAIKIYRKNKSGKEVCKKSFTSHEFCPFCGKKF